MDNSEIAKSLWSFLPFFWHWKKKISAQRLDTVFLERWYHRLGLHQMGHAQVRQKDHTLGQPLPNSYLRYEQRQESQRKG